MRSHQRAAIAAALLLVASCGSSGDARRGDTVSTTTPADGSAESRSTAPSADAASLTIESGFTAINETTGAERGVMVTAAAITTNPDRTKAACAVRVQFNFVAADGTVVNTRTETTSWIPAGDALMVVPLIAGDMSAAPVTLHVSTFVDHWAATPSLAGCDTYAADNAGVVLLVEGAHIERGGNDFVKGQVTNTTSTLIEQSSINCIERGPDGTIVGGERTAILDPIAPGATIAAEVLSYGFIPDTAETAACQVTT